MSKTNGSASGLALLRRWRVQVVGAACAALVGCQNEAQAGPDEGTADVPDLPFVMASSEEEAGRYLVQVAGCNDCHTEGYMEANGEIPESEWLMGSAFGFRGPWGTTWPANLRRTASTLTEDQWVATLKSRMSMPPMPWFNVNRMSESDLRAIHRYLRTLGPAGEPSRQALGPDEEPAGPWFDFVPRNLPAQ